MRSIWPEIILPQWLALFSAQLAIFNIFSIFSSSIFDILLHHYVPQKVWTRCITAYLGSSPQNPSTMTCSIPRTTGQKKQQKKQQQQLSKAPSSAFLTNCIQCLVQLARCNTFFHHYQGSIDFNTVNIHRTVGMYFFVSVTIFLHNSCWLIFMIIKVAKLFI